MQRIIRRFRGCGVTCSEWRFGINGNTTGLLLMILTPTRSCRETCCEIMNINSNNFLKTRNYPNCAATPVGTSLQLMMKKDQMKWRIHVESIRCFEAKKHPEWELQGSVLRSHDQCLLWHCLTIFFSCSRNRWSDKRFLVHVRKLQSHWTTSQTLLAERGIIPYSTKIHWRIQNYSYEFGCQAREAHWWLLEHWWLSRLVWCLDRFSHNLLYSMKKLLTDVLGPGGDWRENSLHPGQIIYGQSYGSQGERMPSWRKSKSGLKKRFILTTHENWGEFISSTLRIRNSKKPSRTHVRSWKHQLLLLCPVKLWRIVGVVDLTKVRKLACILEADKSTRLRVGNSEPNYDEDHVVGKGDNSLQHHNLVHKFIPMPQAMKIPAAKAAVDKEWEKLEKISAWNLTKVKSRKQVIDEARTSGATVHFASLVDICHLKNAELEAKHQKYKGLVVLRGDIVKDDSGSCAVFTEQGSSASQMTAAKIMDIISRLLGCDGQAADAVTACT